MKRNQLTNPLGLFSLIALQACITIEQDGAETYVTVENSIEESDDCCEDDGDCCEDDDDCCDDGCEDEEVVDTGTYEAVSYTHLTLPTKA